MSAYQVMADTIRSFLLSGKQQSSVCWNCNSFWQFVIDISATNILVSILAIFTCFPFIGNKPTPTGHIRYKSWIKRAEQALNISRQLTPAWAHKPTLTSPNSNLSKYNVKSYFVKINCNSKCINIRGKISTSWYHRSGSNLQQHEIMQNRIQYFRFNNVLFIFLSLHFYVNIEDWILVITETQWLPVVMRQTKYSNRQNLWLDKLISP